MLSRRSIIRTLSLLSLAYDGQFSSLDLFSRSPLPPQPSLLQQSRIYETTSFTVAFAKLNIVTNPTFSHLMGHLVTQLVGTGKIPNFSKVQLKKRKREKKKGSSLLN
ncbi:hypothetical protein PanWU01x14_320830 [Parasponia andersonii]|uniref:Uncharacterized protein n=1 Tax=Parasponia andersonii TaxID=3476 RepID=A0A2P5ALG4_PARAD|nr:hypothetical protein PanWU01x14_320830 [Parasponia andersonii]